MQQDLNAIVWPGWQTTRLIGQGGFGSVYEIQRNLMGEVEKAALKVIPNVMPQLIVSMTLGLGGIILYESSLSYLGLGIPLPFAAWGTMISSSTDPVVMANYPNLWIPAGILIVLAVLAFNFVGDGLRDAMDPKAKR